MLIYVSRAACRPVEAGAIRIRGWPELGIISAKPLSAVQKTYICNSLITLTSQQMSINVRGEPNVRMEQPKVRIEIKYSLRASVI